MNTTGTKLRVNFGSNTTRFVARGRMVGEEARTTDWDRLCELRRSDDEDFCRWMVVGAWTDMQEQHPESAYRVGLLTVSGGYGSRNDC